MALLRFQVRIADDHIAHVTHIEVHIHLLERGSPETAGIVGTERHPRALDLRSLATSGTQELIDDGETPGKSLLGRGREIVIADTSDDVQLIGDVPVELCIAVDIVLGVAGVVDELIGREIVVHIVRSEDEAVLAERMVIQRMHDMLLVAVVVVMGTCTVRQEVRLVVFVEGV